MTCRYGLVLKRDDAHSHHSHVGASPNFAIFPSQLGHDAIIFVIVFVVSNMHDLVHRHRQRTHVRTLGLGSG